jgi:hypothetical protein
MDMQYFGVFRPTIRIICPDKTAQLFGGDIRVPLHDFVNPLLDWRQTQSSRRNRLSALRANVSLRL